MTTRRDESDEAIVVWEQWGVLKASHREDDLGLRDDVCCLDKSFEDEQTDVE
jgi:hypothetical protein